MIATKIALALLAVAFVSNPTEAFRLSDRVVGGETAVRGQIPYQVSLRNAATDQHSCGGSIIRSNWILTVAHCLVQSIDQQTQTVIGTNPSDIVVVVGAVLIRGQGSTHNVSQVELHENYDPETLENDLGLLRLTEHIQFNRYAQPIALGEEASYVPAGVSARASGWGRLFFNGPLPEELQFLDVTTLSNVDCRARHTEIPHLVHESTLCAYSSQSERGMCHGDSGGPLVSDGQLIGATSWAYYCARGKPDGFTRISSFQTWILAHIGEEAFSTTPSDFSTTPEANFF